MRERYEVIGSGLGGLTAGAICGPNAACFDVDGFGTILCLYLCATSEGGFGTVHSDCPGGETCEDLYTPEVGICDLE